MILHIIQNEKYTANTIRNNRGAFSADEHPFVVFGGPFRYSYDDFENVAVFRVCLRDTLRLIRLMKKAERIHFHGLFSFVLLCILAFDRKLGEKAVWSILGDDLYCLTRPKDSLANRLHLAIRRRACRNIKKVRTNIRGDYELACQLMGKEYVYLPSRYNPGLITDIRPYVGQRVPHTSLNILVGNSATPTNRHTEVFALLKKYADRDIKVFVALSYGDEQYRESVIEQGKKIFGDKFYPLTTFVSKDEYARFLTSIDVGIFANDRQQAMGNIVALLYAGKKLYMRDDTTMWQSLHDDYHLHISPYSELETASFDELGAIDFDQRAQRQAIEEMTDADLYAQSLRDGLS